MLYLQCVSQSTARVAPAEGDMMQSTVLVAHFLVMTFSQMGQAESSDSTMLWAHLKPVQAQLFSGMK